MFLPRFRLRRFMPVIVGVVIGIVLAKQAPFGEKVVNGCKVVQSWSLPVDWLTALLILVAVGGVGYYAIRLAHHKISSQWRE